MENNSKNKWWNQDYMLNCQTSVEVPKRYFVIKACKYDTNSTRRCDYCYESSTYPNRKQINEDLNKSYNTNGDWFIQSITELSKEDFKEYTKE